MKALLLIDLQNDFLPGGALAVPDGNIAVEVANDLMPLFDLVVASQDWHPKDHLSFASQHAGLKVGDLFDLEGLPQVAWPDHCVQGTEGAEFSSQLHSDEIDLVVRKGQDRNIDSYSAFFDNGQRKATELERELRARDVTELFIMGLATDYCVQYSVLDACRLGFRTNVLLDGCRGVELKERDCFRAIDAMKKAGAFLCTGPAVPDMLK